LPPNPKSWGWAIRPSSYTVLFDACVLYPAPLRDLLIELAAARVLFRAKWSDRIHEEWISNLLINRDDLKREVLERTRQLMDQAVPDCIVSGYEDLIDAINLPDKNDRHVLAAAIRSGCDAIITFNLKHFPVSGLKQYDIDPIHPDEFITWLFELKQSVLVIAAQRCRARLKNPPKTAREYLERLESQGLPQTVDLLSEYESIL